ncbi:hypothetical protein NX801_05535 [Streptomyces sp. LP05-1]|uniref:Uncharacterized protein n=1 Tax=Streptomyces pyxinae TaxID=2970734 RepID=A0ABT2CCI7_9ACTN|nr:hypothetical protein [Streptomyces sp. LP05-1]MCS0635125.1 hypothetical protein [Streptomyces sp. LP05-1]
MWTTRLRLTALGAALAAAALFAPAAPAGPAGAPLRTPAALPADYPAAVGPGIAGLTANLPGLPGGDGRGTGDDGVGGAGDISGIGGIGGFRDAGGGGGVGGGAAPATGTAGLLAGSGGSAALPGAPLPTAYTFASSFRPIPAGPPAPLPGTSAPPPAPHVTACGPELLSPEGIEAQTCVLAEGGDRWARTYYRNATGSGLRAVLTLMAPAGRTVEAHCAVPADDEPGSCETPREPRGERPGAGSGDYTAVAEFAADGDPARSPLLLRSGSNSPGERAGWAGGTGAADGGREAGRRAGTEAAGRAKAE